METQFAERAGAYCEVKAYLDMLKDEAEARKLKGEIDKIQNGGGGAQNRGFQ